MRVRDPPPVVLLLYEREMDFANSNESLASWLDQAAFVRNTIADGYSSDPRDADRLIPVPTIKATLDYGSIGRDIANIARIPAMPIRLSNGRHSVRGGYGISHILTSHGYGIARQGYFSAQDFVDSVAQNYDAIYACRDRRSIIMHRGDDNVRLHGLLVLQPIRQKGFYSVVTGWLMSPNRTVSGMLIATKESKEGVLAWERRAPHSK